MFIDPYSLLHMKQKIKQKEQNCYLFVSLLCFTQWDSLRQWHVHALQQTDNNL